MQLLRIHSLTEALIIVSIDDRIGHHSPRRTYVRALHVYMYLYD
jgi:hypothetical protein